MVCMYCGAENEEGSRFCSGCGRQIGIEMTEQDREDALREKAKESAKQDAKTAPKEDDPDITEINIGEAKKENAKTNPKESARERATQRREEPYEQKRGSSGKKNGRIGLIVLAGVVIVLAILLIRRPAKSGQSAVNLPMGSCVDEEDTAYILMLNGKVVKIDDASSASIAPDRETIVVHDITDTLYITDPGLKRKTDIDEDVLEYYVRDGGVLYYKDGEAFLRRFGASESIKLNNGAINDYLFSKKNGNMIYSADNNVYVLTMDGSEPEKAGKYDSRFEPLYISDDGKIAYWAQDDPDEEDMYNIYSFTGGERNKVCSIKAPSSPGLYFDSNNAFGVIGAYNGESIFLLDKNGNASKVGMGNNVYFRRNYVFTPEGPLYKDSSSSFSGIYVIVAGNDQDTCNLYYIDKEGEREKVISGLKDLYIDGGYLYYLSDDELHCAKLDGSDLKKDEKVSGSVDGMMISAEEYVYFYKDKETGDGYTSYATVYVYKRGKDPIKISSEAWLDHYYISPGGEIAYYYKDPDKDYESATFYKYKYGKDSERISDSAFYDRVTDGTENENYNLLSEPFMYFRKVDESDYKWMLFDGKKSSEKVIDLKRNDLF